MSSLKDSLKAKALKARQNIDGLHKAYDSFNESAGQHAGQIGQMVTEITEMADDLNAATRVMGNGFEEADGEKSSPPSETFSGSTDKPAGT